MAGEEEEKTEEPTPKKIEDAIKEGNVPKSMEVVGAATLFFGTVYLLFLSSYSFTEIKKMMIFVYNFIGSEMDGPLYYTISYTATMSVLYGLLPIFALVVILTFIFNWVQFGMIFVPIKLKLETLDPINGLQNVFSFKKAIEALKLSLKLVIIFTVMVILFLLTGDDFLAMMDKELNAAIDAIQTLLIYFLFTILGIIIIFAIIDFYFTRYYYFKSLRMSKQDLRDEFKNMEGDPQVKARIRSIQVQMSRKRMMKNVPEADVVITNPTHYAVALKYDQQKNSAPVMVAKGVDFIALKIKDIARENSVPIIENPSLARALYAQLELDQQIPEEFYKAIAEIFSYVYELKRKR